MKLPAAELAYVRSQGLYVTEKCDGCSKLLNQSVRYTIKDRPEVYCVFGLNLLWCGGQPRAAGRPLYGQVNLCRVPLPELRTAPTNSTINSRRLFVAYPTPWLQLGIAKGQIRFLQGRPRLHAFQLLA